MLPYAAVCCRILPYAGAKRGAISRTACLPDGHQEEAPRAQAEEEEPLEVVAAAAAASARSQTAQEVLQLTCVTGTNIQILTQPELALKRLRRYSAYLRSWYKSTNTDAASDGSQTPQAAAPETAVEQQYKY
jgi:hypothetical protein